MCSLQKKKNKDKCGKEGRLNLKHRDKIMKQTSRERMNVRRICCMLPAVSCAFTMIPSSDCSCRRPCLTSTSLKEKERNRKAN